MGLTNIWRWAMNFKDIQNLKDLEKLYPEHILKRFPIAGKGPWKNVSDDDWNSWIWQQKTRIKDLKNLNFVINITEDEKRAFTASDEMFHMGITPYYSTLMDENDPKCPVRLQSVPQPGELSILDTDLEDPLGEEKDMPVPGITHRYPDRVLFYTTHNCPVYCRHCTRKRKVSDPSTSAANKQIEGGLTYIRNHPEIRDVILSGGDPLSLSNKKLEHIFSELRKMPHIELIRLGTRNLVTLPQRVDDELIEIMQKYAPIHVNTHFNHPKEMTREALLTSSRLALAGITMGNQTVLLKGVNDDVEIQKELCHKLLLMRIRPYYIYQCDLAQGISHFRTTIEKGIEIIEGLRGWTSGLAIPHFVIDAPGGGGKLPVGPEYFVKREGNKITLRNYEGKEFVYYEPEGAYEEYMKNKDELAKKTS
ncbi:MAG: KamA family radical SAM protein [Halobacteriovoraceae bacterium]|nr:KamA family radical SAM protein [Halobacteriovoraceae bacterium]